MLGLPVNLFAIRFFQNDKKDKALSAKDQAVNIAFIYHILNIIDLIDETGNGTFVPSKAQYHMLKDIIKLINNLYHPERIG